MRLVIVFLMTFSCALSAIAAEVPAASSVADESPRILSFSQWKELQTVEASNRVARTSNRVMAAKRQKLDAEAVAAFKREHRKAVQAQDIAQQLTMEEYFLVYLSDFEDSARALREAAKLMSHEEVAQLIQVMLKSRHGVRAASLRTSMSPFLTGPASKTP